MIQEQVTINTQRTSDADAQVIRATQGENRARTYAIRILDSGGSYISLSGKTVIFYVEKNDGTAAQLPMTIQSDGITAEVTLTLQAAACAGDNNCTIEIMSGTEVLRVKNLILRVKPCELDDAVESKDEFTLLDDLLQNGQGMSGHQHGLWYITRGWTRRQKMKSPICFADRKKSLFIML